MVSRSQAIRAREIGKFSTRPGERRLTTNRTNGRECRRRAGTTNALRTRRKDGKTTQRAEEQGGHSRKWREFQSPPYCVHDQPKSESAQTACGGPTSRPQRRRQLLRTPRSPPVLSRVDFVAGQRPFVRTIAERHHVRLLLLGDLLAAVLAAEGDGFQQLAADRTTCSRSLQGTVSSRTKLRSRVTAWNCGSG